MATGYDPHYDEKLFVRVTDELLKQYPLPEGWVWQNEGMNNWAGAKYPEGSFFVVNRDGSGQLTCIFAGDEEDIPVSSAEEGYMLIWNRIMLGG